MRALRPAGVAPAGEGTDLETPGRGRRWIVLLWSVALVAAIFLVVGHLGFQPTDEGNIAAQTHRLLDGQVPHRDVIFARPMGSALLHVIDFGVPMPLFEASRLIGIAEIVLYSVCLAWLIFDLAPSRWGLARSVAAAASALVNLHTFLLNGWYTTDGLVFVALGFVMLRSGLARDRRWVLRIGLLALGLAAVMKQSFAAASLLGLVWVVSAGRARPMRERVRSAASAAVLLAAPMLVYIAAITARGALDEFLGQILGADTVYGASFVTVFRRSGPRWELIAGLAGLVALLWVRRRAERSNAAALDVASRVGISLLVVGVVLAHRLAFRGSWAVILLWGVVAFVGWRAAVERTFDGVGAVLVLTGWMAALSWGYAVPNLVAGSLALYLLDRTWRGAARALPAAGTPARSRLVAAGIALAGLATGALFVAVRFAHPYGDRPEAELTASLRAASPEWGRIRTNPATASYLTELASCVRSHPARWTAALPDNPGIYPALDLRNPFPIDWMYPDEVAGEEERILQTARRLAREGDYTVLFQTYPIARLTEPGPFPPPAGPDSVPLARPLLTRIWRILDGTRFTCGPFVGVTAPASS